jgi:hypothetical protein
MFTAFHVHYHGRHCGIEGFVMRSEAIPTGSSLSRWSIHWPALVVALFGIVVVGVAGQGLLLPSVVRRLGLGNYAAAGITHGRARSSF